MKSAKKSHGQDRSCPRRRRRPPKRQQLEARLTVAQHSTTPSPKVVPHPRALLVASMREIDRSGKLFYGSRPEAHCGQIISEKRYVATKRPLRARE